MESTKERMLNAALDLGGIVLDNIKLVALPCLCADVFFGTDEIRAGGEALNFAAHASKFDEVDVTILGVLGNDEYARHILDSIANKRINTANIRIDERHATAHNITYLSTEGDRYYKDDSWNGEILDNIVLNDKEREIISGADVVFVHIWASCFEEVLELKKKHGFKLAVDFDVFSDYDKMKQLAPFIDFFMISGTEEVLPDFKSMSECNEGLFNVTLAERGSVTYHKGVKYRIPAVPVENVVDTTGCGDSYHAGFVCSYMIDGDITKAMEKGAEFASDTLSHYGGF